MITEIEAKNVGTVIAKDMSRLERDYLIVGYYTEIYFVEKDIMYIAINNCVDSAKGDNDFTPFRNLFNDFYEKDTSKKVRAIKRAQGQAGQHLGKPQFDELQNIKNIGNSTSTPRDLNSDEDVNLIVDKTVLQGIHCPFQILQFYPF